jgi:hypothetical protein
MTHQVQNLTNLEQCYQLLFLLSLSLLLPLETFAQLVERKKKLLKAPFSVKKLAKIIIEKIFTLAHEVGEYHG